MSSRHWGQCPDAVDTHTGRPGVSIQDKMPGLMGQCLGDPKVAGFNVLRPGLVPGWCGTGYIIANYVCHHYDIIIALFSVAKVTNHWQVTGTAFPSGSSRWPGNFSRLCWGHWPLPISSPGSMSSNIWVSSKCIFCCLLSVLPLWCHNRVPCLLFAGGSKTCHSWDSFRLGV